MRILVVEDEMSLADLISARLKKEKYNVDISYDGEDGLYNAMLDIYDLIILDIMLPNINGIEILKEIKKNNIKSKVIMLTAKSELEDKLLGFNEGANDYITKPFDPMELLARVEVVLRRSSKNNVTFKYKNLEIDFNERTVLMNGEEIELTTKEFDLLEVLIRNKNLALSREKLLLLFEFCVGLYSAMFTQPVKGG